MGRVKWWFFAVGLALWMASAMGAKDVAGYGAEVQLRCYESSKINRALLEQMRGMEAEQGRESVVEAAAWNLEHNVTVENESLFTSQDAVCFLVWGNKGQIVKGRLLKGSYGYPEDTKGCVISRVTAWKLFGSLDVVGKWVKCQEKRWVIRGVTAYQNLSFLYRSDKGIEKRTHDPVQMV